MPTCIIDSKTVYCMRENLKSFSGDSFTIKDEKGDIKFTVDGTALSISEKKTLKDVEGLSLYQINEQTLNFSFREKQFIIDAETGETCFTLRKKSAVFERNTVEVFSGGDDEGEPVFIISGGFMQKNFDIKKSDGETIVCEVDRRQFTVSSIFTDKDTYAISVEAGQDAALMIAFAVAIDEIYRED